MNVLPCLFFPYGCTGGTPVFILKQHWLRFKLIVLHDHIQNTKNEGGKKDQQDMYMQESCGILGAAQRVSSCRNPRELIKLVGALHEHVEGEDT